MQGKRFVRHACRLSIQRGQRLPERSDGLFETYPRERCAFGPFDPGIQRDAAIGRGRSLRKHLHREILPLAPLRIPHVNLLAQEGQG